VLLQMQTTTGHAPCVCGYSSSWQLTRRGLMSLRCAKSFVKTWLGQVWHQAAIGQCTHCWCVLSTCSTLCPPWVPLPVGATEWGNCARVHV